MVQFIHAVLRNALQQAMREEKIMRNVAKLVQVGAPDYEVGRGLSVLEARRVLMAAAEEDFHALYVLALYLGLRRAELLGLRWSDTVLDPDPGQLPLLEVRQTLQRVNGTLQFVPPKTRTSRRTIPLPAVCVEALRQHAKRQADRAIEIGNNWQDHCLVFPSRLGTPMEPDNLRRSWERIKKVAAVELRFHDLRHSCVTLLLDLGVPPHVVREIAGHSDLEVTMTVYAHVSLEEKYRALTRLDERLAREALPSDRRQTDTEAAGE
jgi:integrase